MRADTTLPLVSITSSTSPSHSRAMLVCICGNTCAIAMGGTMTPVDDVAAEGPAGRAVELAAGDPDAAGVGEGTAAGALTATGGGVAAALLKSRKPVATVSRSASDGSALT